MLRMIAATAFLAMVPTIVTATDTLNALTEQEKAEGWMLLFDGKTTKGWHNFNGTGVDPRWRIENGELVMTAWGGGDLETDASFSDFELSLEWKISPKGNSGIIYRVLGAGSAQPWQTGLEYQILDNKGNKETPVHQAGALYDLYAAERDVTKPAGQFNHTRIIVRDNHVEHWLNGVKIVSFELGSAAFKARVAKSKFSKWPFWGAIPRGTIVLQDHIDRVSFRNIKIRLLD